MGPLTCPQSYRRFITAHWARKKYRIQSIRGFRFLWDQWAVGYTLALLLTCFLTVSSCVSLSLSYCFLHSLTHSAHTLKKTKYMEIVCKGRVISLVKVSLMGLGLLLSLYYETPQKYPIFFLCSFFKKYQGFSFLNIPKMKNKPCNGVWALLCKKISQQRKKLSPLFPDIL